MTKKRIAIIALGYAWLPGEKGPSRFYDLANVFADAGYEVELIGSSFQHFEKKPRDRQILETESYRFKNIFIDVPSYNKNIDWRRIWSNRVAAKNVLRYLESQEVYDGIYCAIPANNVAAAVSIYCKSHKVPLIIDVEDLWPEAMKMIFHFPPISSLLYYPMKRDAEVAYKNANGVIGTSDDYTDRAFQRRTRDIPAETVYVGCDLSFFDKGAERFADIAKKPQKEFWVSYAGSIGASYDIKTLIYAAKAVERDGYRQIRFKIMGTGPLLDEMKLLAEKLQCENTEFFGYVEYSHMAACLTQSDVVINSFIKGAPQSIVNKVGDYLASGSAMINTLENKVFTDLVEHHNFGINIEPENVNKLKEVIEYLYDSPDILERLGNNARKCAETRFDRRLSYQKAVEMMEGLLKERR